MFEFVGWTIVVAFAVTTVITLLDLVGRVTIPDQYLSRLFTALVLEIIASGFFIFKYGFAPERAYFGKASALMAEAREAHQNKDYEKADRVLGDILKLPTGVVPFDIRAVFRERGDLAYEQHSWASAAQSYGTYYQINPDDLDALIRYGIALRKIGQYERAAEVFGRGYALSPNNYQVLNGLQNVSRRMGAFFLDAERIDAAEAQFEQAREYIGRMLDATVQKKDGEEYKVAALARARLYWEWRRYPEAVAAYEKFIAEVPDYVTAQEDLAALLLEVGERNADMPRLTSARDLYRKLYVEKPQGSDPIFNGAGFAEAVALASDSPSPMQSEAEQAVLLSLAELKGEREDPYPFYAAALLFDRLGRHEQAVDYLKSAIRHERQRASDPYRFDYVRLLKYEKLLQKWTLK